LEAMKRERQNKNLILETLIKGIDSRPLAIDEFDERLGC